MHSPLPLKSTLVTGSAWAGMVRVLWPVCGSQKRRVSSSLPLAHMPPEGEKAQQKTSFMWAVKSRRRLPVEVRCR